jgi:hypothetical protein
MTIKRKFIFFHLIIVSLLVVLMGVTPYVFLSNNFTSLIHLIEVKLAFNARKFELLKLWSVLTLTVTFALYYSLRFDIKLSIVGLKIRQQKKVMISIFMLVLTRNLILDFAFAMGYDEAFSFLYNVSKGPIVSYLYYPGPNNHVLFTTASSFLSFIDNPMFVMRGLNIVLSPLIYCLLFILVKEKFDKETAFIFTILLFFNSSLACYSIVGRGYLFLLFFSVLLFVSRKSTTHFILFTVLGFLTSPVFLFPFIGVILFYIWDLRQVPFKKLTIATLISIHFYLPILVINGWGNVMNNSWVQCLSVDNFIAQLSQFVYHLPDWLLGLPVGFLLFSFSLLLFLYFSKNKHTAYIYLLVTLVISFIGISVIKQVIAPERIFIYLIPVFLLPTSWLIASRIKWGIIPLLSYVIWNSFTLYNTSVLSHKSAIEYQKVADLCRIDKQVISTNDNYKVMAAFYLHNDGFEPKLKTMNNPHKALILDKHLYNSHDFKKYKLMYENDDILYLRKHD